MDIVHWTGRFKKFKREEKSDISRPDPQDFSYEKRYQSGDSGGQVFKSK